MRPIRDPRVLVLLFVALAAALLASFWDDIGPFLRGATVLGLILLSGFGLGAARVKTTPDPPDPRTDILERVVADETRRPWSPTTLPWLPTGSMQPVLLVPAADYHLVEIVALAHELNRRDTATRVAIGASPWERTWPALSAYPDLELYELPDADRIGDDISAVLVMKDTGSLGPMVARWRELGVPTLGKVEGAQDFWDADTPEERTPYTSLDLVLCQGEFDASALAGRDTAVVGSTRLERLWWAPPVNVDEPLAVINLNFVYGVGTKERRLWLDSAIEGCDLAGIPYVISVHPAERARPASRRVTSISASRLLPRASVLISRFSTVPLEAMARGVPFVYHNPHGETVRTYADPMGAFEVTATAEELHKALAGLAVQAPEIRRRVERFFLHHVDVDPATTSERRGAAAISAALSG